MANNKSTNKKDFIKKMHDTCRSKLKFTTIEAVLSHIKALQDFLMTEEKYALVLEDDLIQVVNIDLTTSD